MLGETTAANQSLTEQARHLTSMVAGFSTANSVPQGPTTSGSALVDRTADRDGRCATDDPRAT